MIEDLKVRIVEYSQYFNQSKENCNESDSSLDILNLKLISMMILSPLISLGLI